MPILMIAVIGGAIGLYVFLNYPVTQKHIAYTAIALIGAGLGFYILRGLFVLGPVTAILGAAGGAVLLLWAFTYFGRKD
ncbi:MAG: hypothetical protein AAGF74_16020 [Pseudomonadota bacterium]